MAGGRLSLCIETFHGRRHMDWFDINPCGVLTPGSQQLERIPLPTGLD